MEPVFSLGQVVFFGLYALIFGCAIGYLIGRYRAKCHYEYFLTTAEEKLKLAEHAWERINSKEREVDRAKKLEKIRKYREWEFAKSLLPNSIPKDF